MGKKNTLTQDFSALKLLYGPPDLKVPNVPKVLKGPEDPPCLFEKIFTKFCRIKSA